MKARSLRIAKAMDAGKRVRKGGSVTFESPIEMARAFTVGRLQVYGAVKTQPIALPALANPQTFDRCHTNASSGVRSRLT